ncbi:unnamed protein product [Choristocarpus tenellus]
MAVDGSVLHDSHAEVLVRRALVLLLWKELGVLLRGRDENSIKREHKTPADEIPRNRHPDKADSDSMLLCRTKEGWRLKPYLNLHLYVSDPPCGDASIYQSNPASGMGRGTGPTRKCKYRYACARVFMSLVDHQRLPRAISMNPPPNRSMAGSAGEGAGLTGKCEQGLELQSCQRPTKRTCLPVPVGACQEATAVTPRHISYNKRHPGCMKFTGAKAIGSCASAVEVVHKRVIQGKATAPGEVDAIFKEDEQTLGVLRTKSGRSDIQSKARTTSMSCSDKIVKWTLLGLQGGLLSMWVEPIRLSSITVSADPSTSPASLEHALRRAVPERVERAWPGVVTGPEDPVRLAVFVTSAVFERGKTQSEWQVLQQEFEAESSGDTEIDGTSAVEGAQSVVTCTFGNKSQMIKPSKRSRTPSGTALNWFCHPKQRGGRGSCEVEVTLSGTGRKQGATGRGAWSLRTRSRLCRAKVLEEAEAVMRVTSEASAWSHSFGTEVQLGGNVGEPNQSGDGHCKSTPLRGLRTYIRLKEACGSYRMRRKAMLSHPMFDSWLVGNESLQMFLVGGDGVVPMSSTAPEGGGAQ